MRFDFGFGETLSLQAKYNVYEGIFGKIRHIYFKKIACSLKKGSVVLDVGCGQGDFLLACKNAGLACVGVDISKDWVSHCKKLGFDSKQVAQSGKLPFKECSFDVVFLQSVIEHLDDASTSMQEFKRMLKPGGLLVISAPTPEDAFWDDPTHKRPYTPKALKTLFQISGFSQVRCTYVLFFLLGVFFDFNRAYKLINLLPFSAGGNVLCFGKK